MLLSSPLTHIPSLAAVTGSALVETAGRFHVLLVHFPIALLVVAAAIELWRFSRGRREASSAAVTCLGLGAFAAVVATVLGLIDASYKYPDGDANTHKWLGIVTSVLAVVVWLLARRAESGTRVWALRYGSVLAAVLVSITGHFGGELTYGSGYLTELVFGGNEPKSKTVDTTAVADSSATEDAATKPSETASTAPAAQAVTSNTEFATVVHPLLASACYECHSGNSAKGGLRLDSEQAALKGGSSGTAVVPGDSEHSLLVRRVLGMDGKKRMPPGKPPLSAEQVAALRKWIDGGAKWDGMKLAAAAPAASQPSIRPRKVDLPPGDEKANPIDRVLAGYYAKHKVSDPGVVDDRTYARRVYLDVLGMVATPAEMDEFVYDVSPDKRVRLVRKLLADTRRYAENWMSFWNDALRNDYAGVGYIDGGRSQITGWLYNALQKNVPYDQFVRDLVSPSTKESEGFIKGIIWRGAVSASQRRELQAAQNLSQVFLGMNLKCASCHDSFINQWKLADAYGLAGVFADEPLEMYRCEAPQGSKAPIQFLYPELGSIDGGAKKEAKMKRLAELLTSSENARFSRTIVNRLWARFMGRGLVEPVDEMDNPAWNDDLIDFLANDLTAHNHDLKHTIELILTSRAYQRPSVGILNPDAKEFTFAGPVVRRMSAEQFCDTVSELTGVWPTSPATAVVGSALPQKFIWNNGLAGRTADPGTIYFRKTFDLKKLPAKAVAAITADNEWRLLVNGTEVSKGTEWQKPDVVDVTPLLVAGKNVIAVAATNGEVADKSAPNPAALWVLVSAKLTGSDDPKESYFEISTDATWKWSAKPEPGWETQSFDDEKWQKSAAVGSGPYNLQANLDATRKKYRLREDKYRAVWTKADPLAVALGRPNREQVVTYRPTAATTLQALELTNGQTLATTLKYGATNWAEKNLRTAGDLVEQVYRISLSRRPTEAEKALAVELVGTPTNAEGIEDLLWSIVMLPEFQLVY